MRGIKQYRWAVCLFVCLALPFVYLALCRTIPRRDTDQTRTYKNSNICGPYCLVSVLQYFGKDIQLHEILPVISSQQGSSMLELKEIAEAYGLKTLGVRTDLINVFAEKRPAILHVNGNHFIALLPDRNSPDCIVIDVPETHSISTCEEFSGKWNWDGTCLYVDEEEIGSGARKADGVPKLYVEEADFDAGIVYDEQKSISHTFLLKNIGDKNLVIEDFKSGCSCTYVEDEEIVIKPNETYSLNVKFRLSQKIGPLPKQSIVVISNDPLAPQTRLSMRAERRKEFLVSPGVIQLGILKDVAKKAVLFKVTSENLTKRLLPEKSYVNLDFIKVENARQYKRNDFWEYLFKVEILATAPYGRFAGEFVIPSSGSIRKEISVPISGEISSPVSLSRSKITYGLIDAKQPERILKTIELWSDTVFSIDGISNETKYLSASSKMVNANKYIVSVELDPTVLPDGAFSDEIVIHVQSERRFDAIVLITGYLQKAG